MLGMKLEALKKYLVEFKGVPESELKDITVNNCYNAYWKQFELGNYGSYIVLTDEEADDTARENILNDLWVFCSDFILEHMSGYDRMTNHEVDEFKNALSEMQKNLCESCNAIVRALISDIDNFIDDAIEADGRGHFIASYDLVENEQDGFYIYRMD